MRFRRVVGLAEFRRFAIGRHAVFVDDSTILLGIPTTTAVGVPDAASFTPEGLITIVLSKDKVASPGTGDLLGNFEVRTYNVDSEVIRTTNAIDQATNATANDFTANAATYALVGPPPQPDLIVAELKASNNKARQGDKVTFTAKITNAGQQSAGASKTEFLLDGATVLGLIDTPALGPGASATVSVNWLTASATKGQHTIKTTADKNNIVAESNEANNTKTITVSIQGNKTRK